MAHLQDVLQRNCKQHDFRMKPHTPTSDRQLWRNVEDSGRSWPVYATPSQCDGPCYFVELAVPAETSEQWKFASHWAGKFAFDTDGTHWLVRVKTFEQVFLKCDGVTPGYWLKWPEMEQKRTAIESSQPVEATTQPLEMKLENQSDDFLHYCCAENGWTNFAQIKAVFTAICGNAVGWLLEKRKPLDLNFCTIHTLPLRKEALAMLADHKDWSKLLVTLRRKKHRMGVLEANGFLPYLHSPDLVEMASDETFAWNLFITENKSFEKTAESLERETLRNSTPARYVLRLGNQIKKSYATIVNLFHAYLEKKNRSMGKVVFAGGRSNFSLHPKVPHYRHRAARPKGIQDGAAGAPVETAKESQREGAIDAKAAQDLPPVRDV
jgi:hypothetical protein